MDKEHEDALKLTKDDLVAKLRAGRPADLARGVTFVTEPGISDAPTAVEVKSVAVWIPAPTLVPA